MWQSLICNKTLCTVIFHSGFKHVFTSKMYLYSAYDRSSKVTIMDLFVQETCAAKSPIREYNLSSRRPASSIGNLHARPNPNILQYRNYVKVFVQNQSLMYIQPIWRVELSVNSLFGEYQQHRPSI